MVEDGKLKRAIQRIQPSARRPRYSTVICDNESFLKTPGVKKAYRREKISLWHIPAASPDLNPVEMFWGWLRKQLSKLDQRDLEAGRPVPTKGEYWERVRKLVRSAQGQRVARSDFLGLRKSCRKVVANEGAHSGR